MCLPYQYNFFFWTYDQQYFDFDHRIPELGYWNYP